MSRSGTFSEQDLHFSGICGSVSTEFERFARANLSNSVLTLPQIPEKCKSCSENVPERLIAAVLKN